MINVIKLRKKSFNDVYIGYARNCVAFFSCAENVSYRYFIGTICIYFHANIYYHISTKGESI